MNDLTVDIIGVMLWIWIISERCEDGYSQKSHLGRRHESQVWGTVAGDVKGPKVRKFHDLIHF